jgi:integrase
MRVFKPTYKDRTGKKKVLGKWWCELRDHLGIVRRFPGISDKAATTALGKKIETLVGYRMGGEPPSPDLVRWLQQVPAKLSDHFVKIGLLDSTRAAGAKLLKEHIADFHKSLLAKGDSKKQAQQVSRRTKVVMTGCKFRTWSDIRADRIEQYLADLRSGKKALSAQTSNFYLQACQQFCRWMIQNGRASESPLSHLRRLNVKVDRRHDRIALEVGEMRRLLAATGGGPERYGMTGAERVLLYRVAVETGMRRNELASLQVSSFDLDRLTVTVRAAYSKRRREDTLPLRSETAEELRTFLAGKLPTAKAFGGRYKRLTDKTANMIEADLTEAGIPYQDEAGRFRDFHALRATTASWLAACGVHPKVAQQILRHSDINLTMNTYTHLLGGKQEAEAVACLPDLSAIQQEQRATGTDAANVTQNDLASYLAFLPATQCNSMQRSAIATPTNGSKNAVLTTPGRIRTCDLRFRKPTLYPTELRARQF